jgi:SAM-dependent methyltransferase
MSLTHLRPGQQALDVAGGTGDIAQRLLRQVSPTGRVVLTDINAEMLSQGRDRLLDAGIAQGIEYVQANAECLPFADASVRLRHHRVRPAQCHRQARGAALDAPRAEAGRAAARARVLATRRPGLEAAV